MKRALFIFFALVLALTACGAPEAVETASPPPPPTASPVPTEAPIIQRAEEILASMSTHEKLCQLIVVGPEVLSDGSETECDEAMAAALEKWPVCGVVMGLDNLVTKEQTVAMIDGMQDLCKLKLLVCADEEGGNVGRLMYKLGTTYFRDMFIYKDKGEETAYANAYAIGRDMVDCHFNTDLAPVADVWTNPENTVIASRAYSDDYDEAAVLVAAAVRGFGNAGVVTCLKHFPGHGDTAEDSHVSAAVSDRTLDELMEGELLPFLSGMAAGADMIMTGHIIVPELDELPASISYTLITKLLRRSLGYEGVVITDGLEMAALSQYTEAEKAIRCIAAGNDILLGVSDIEAAVEGLEAAIGYGSITMERVDESVMRILLMKLQNGIIE